MTDTFRPDSAQNTAAHVVRRRYLIDPKRQLRTVFITTCSAAVLVLLVDVGFGLLRTSQSSFITAVSPRLKPLVERQETTFLLMMLTFSVLVIVGVALRTIVETHRTAGAVFAVKQRIERVAAGDLFVRLRLRHKDNLADLEKPFNAMVERLRDNATAEAESLQELADRAAGAGAEGATVATELRTMAERKLAGSASSLT